MSKPNDLKLAFGLLVSADRGAWGEWPAKADAGDLRSRVALLAVLLDVVPRSEIERLDEVIEAWGRRFSVGAVFSASELRSEALKTLRPAVRPPGFTKRRVSGDGERLGSLGLAMWKDRLLNDPYWTYLPSVVPGEVPIPIDNVFVELFAAPDVATPAGVDGSQRVPRQFMASRFAVVSVTAMIARTLERCVVLGEPGSGKSTLVQWLARFVASGTCPDFDVALVVKLGAYAEAIGKNRVSLVEFYFHSLTEFFFHSLGMEEQDWRSAADWLREHAKKSRSCLLLLDGWDEVPANQRSTVHDHIEQEQPYFVTVITSRPSGSPRQLDGTVRTDFYRIAGLSPRATRELTEKLLQTLGRSDLAATILRQIEETSDLQELATNPFLLGLLVRVLVRTDAKDISPRTLTDVFEQITVWIQEHYDALPASVTYPMTWEHIAGLRRLAYDKLFGSSGAPYVFGRLELWQRLDGKTVDAVLRSRFVNRTDPVYDEYTFLHATFQEFFAAVHASSLTEAEFGGVIQKAFASASRLIVLEFIAGMSGPRSQLLEERAKYWLDHPDRFHQVVRRVARLVAAGRWSADQTRSVGMRVRDELWSEISTIDEMASVKAAVEAFAALDAVDLCRRAKRARGMSSWAVNCIIETVPAGVARQERIIDLMEGAWGDFAGAELREEVTITELERMRRVLADQAASEEDQYEAVVFLGAVCDAGSVPALVAFMTDAQMPARARTQAIDSLGAIGGRMAVDALVDVLTGSIQLSDEGRRMAAGILRNTEGARKALDPAGRDRLLRHLAVVGHDDPYVIFILAALEGHPIRDGAEIIADMIEDRQLAVAVRSQAARSLVTAADSRIAARVVALVQSEPSPEVSDAMLDLAVRRRLAVPLDWLQRRIGPGSGRVETHRLLKRFVDLIAQSQGEEWENATKFLYNTIKRALRADGGEEESDWAKALTTVLATAEKLDRSSIREEAFHLARSYLAKFVATPESVPEGRVLLAVAVISQFGSADAGPDVRRALDVVLELDDERGSKNKRRDRMASAMTTCLAKIAPGDLLAYPFDCDPVQRALRSAAGKHGWLVYADRILDAEGTLIATATPGSAPPASSRGAAELQDVLRHLAPQRKRALLSYWLMAGPNGPCQQADSLKDIHDAMKKRASGEIEDDLSESVMEIYPDGLPKWEAWRKALALVAKDFTNQPELLDVLRRIGLLRRQFGSSR